MEISSYLQACSKHIQIFIINLSLIFVACALWTFGEAIPCDQCGRECADICGTRQFRACCFNNMRKRHSDTLGLKIWMRPRRYAFNLYPIYDA
ncbi:hypothetical protein X777_07504 [Ooceraea biroi]|uniref:Trissin n=1 Tax=Ooceraea biroi TaxID=2015173 RepID=A0A026X5H6_OOCBI|nr:hypothetical protein X777_07504 [Ooceraea biroi]